MLTTEEKKNRKRIANKAYHEANRDKINAAERARRTAKREAEKKLFEETGIKIRKLWNTGYGRGRPKIGEVRPPSINAIRCANYRADNADWKEYNRINQAIWKQNNPERSKEIQRNYRWRKADRKKYGMKR